MPENNYSLYAGAEPYFELVRRALGDLVDGEHFFDIVADDIVYEVRYDLGWPRVVRGRTDLMDQFKGYVGSIRLRSADQFSSTKRTTAMSLRSSMRSTGRSSRRVPSMKIGSARSSNLETGRSRTGEITWTRMRPGTH